MTKTVFYTPSETEEGDYWFNNKPYKQWFTINTLYDSDNGYIVRKTRTVVGKEVVIKRASLAFSVDIISDTGIERKIAIHEL